MNNPTLLRLLLLAVLLGPGSVTLAQQDQEDAILLTITGDLIGELESLDESAGPGTVINGYYALLPQQTQDRLAALRANLNRRGEDYLVAFRSGDTAEMNETLDDLGFYWASIRTIHAREFTEAVIAQLNEAYGALYEFVGSAN